MPVLRGCGHAPPIAVRTRWALLALALGACAPHAPAGFNTPIPSASDTATTPAGTIAGAPTTWEPFRVDAWGCGPGEFEYSCYRWGLPAGCIRYHVFSHPYVGSGEIQVECTGCAAGGELHELVLDTDWGDLLEVGLELVDDPDAWAPGAATAYGCGVVPEPTLTDATVVIRIWSGPDHTGEFSCAAAGVDREHYMAVEGCTQGDVR